jgi:hypothetical protein
MAVLAVCACAALALATPGFAQTCDCPVAEVSAGPAIQSEEAPPPLPEYDQPPMPEPGDYWTPGYWAWNTYDYYWVPGVWVPPPQPGLLWTPAYWVFVGGAYYFRPGYWAPHVGFYGGVNYGFGYNGSGYAGGRWENGRFLYNSTVNNFGAVHVDNVYSERVDVPSSGVGRKSFNGGPGGILLRPTPDQERLMTEDHLRPTPLQVNQARTASLTADQFNSVNRGKPAVAATPRPGDFKGPGVMPAKGAGTAQTAPAPEQTPPPPTNAGQNREEKPPQSEKALKPEQKIEQKPPGAQKPVKPEPVRLQPINPQRVDERKQPALEKPSRPEPRVEQKLLRVGKPSGAETTVRPQLSPKTPARPSLERPQELRRPVAPAAATAPANPARPPLSVTREPPRPPAGAVERKPPQPRKPDGQCGGPRQPICPR